MQARTLSGGIFYSIQYHCLSNQAVSIDKLHVCTASVNTTLAASTAAYPCFVDYLMTGMFQGTRKFCNIAYYGDKGIVLPRPAWPVLLKAGKTGLCRVF